MILYVSQEYYGEAVPIPFPATMEQVRDELGGLGVGSQPLFIRGSGPVWHFEDRIDPADLLQKTGVQKLNQLGRFRCHGGNQHLEHRGYRARRGSGRNLCGPGFQVQSIGSGLSHQYVRRSDQRS